MGSISTNIFFPFCCFQVKKIYWKWEKFSSYNWDIERFPNEKLLRSFKIIDFEIVFCMYTFLVDLIFLVPSFSINFVLIISSTLMRVDVKKNLF
jgi:hypothetical protein